jgi:hypothetical protein
MDPRDESLRGLAGYEPPRVERVLTPGELEREILYAGEPGPTQDEVSQ